MDRVLTSGGGATVAKRMAAALLFGRSEGEIVNKVWKEAEVRTGARWGW